MAKETDTSLQWLPWAIAGGIRLTAVNEFWHSVAGIKSSIMSGILTLTGFIPGIGDLLVFIGACWGWGWAWYQAIGFGIATLVAPFLFLILSGKGE